MRLNKVETVRLHRSITPTDTGHETPCWLWTGRLNANGYALGQRGPGYPKRVIHRIMWESANNMEVPDGKQLDHLCRTRNCVNPDHLEAVTPSVNTSRQSHANRNKTHCKRGHEFTEENTRVTSRGRRVCRACERGDPPPPPEQMAGEGSDMRSTPWTAVPQ